MSSKFLRKFEIVANRLSLEFEITPIIERSVDLFFEHMYPTYPLLSKDAVLGWLQTPHMLSHSQRSLIWSICASTLVMVSILMDEALLKHKKTVYARAFFALSWHHAMEL